jgi:hypothetical protein
MACTKKPTALVPFACSPAQCAKTTQSAMHVLRDTSWTVPRANHVRTIALPAMPQITAQLVCLDFTILQATCVRRVLRHMQIVSIVVHRLVNLVSRRIF